jgi:methionyl-tRNA formyltransferase
MRIGIMGRTKMLLDTAHLLIGAGHEIVFVWTCRTENYYGVGENEFRALAKECKCAYIEGLDINANLGVIRSLGAEVCISMNWITLLKSAFRSLFRYGVLNAHAGDLPRYRGNACPNWAILNFEDRIGLTIHKMVDELDAGPYLVKEFLYVDSETYIENVYDWLSSAVPQAFVKSVEMLKNSGFTEQDPGLKPLRTFPRKPEDSRINWNDSVRNIIALIRASSHPFEGAFCFMDNVAREKVVVFRAEPFTPDYSYFAIPGQVCLTVDGDPVIASLDGMMKLTECSVRDFDNPKSKSLISKSLRNRLV